MISFLVFILIGLIGIASLVCSYIYSTDDSGIGSGESNEVETKDPKDYYATYSYVSNANTADVLFETVTVSEDTVVVKTKTATQTLTEEYTYRYMDLEEASLYEISTPMLALYKNGNTAQFLPLQIIKNDDGIYYLTISSAEGTRVFTKNAVTWEDVKP